MTQAQRATPTLIPALPTLGPSALRLRGPRTLPFPLDEPASRRRLYYLARAAIVDGLRRFALPPGSVALLPSYHHGVEVEAVRAAGLEVRFYRVDERIGVDLEDLERRIDLRTRVLYLTHFAGFPGPVADAAAIARSHGLLLLEDCALALLSRHPDGEPLGRRGDLSVFCLYKSLPVPHGGVLVSTLPPAPPSLPPPLLATLSHTGGSLLRRIEMSGGAAVRWTSALRKTFRVVKAERRMPTGGQHILEGELGRSGSRLLEPLLRALDYDAIAARRRENYTRLLELLGDDAQVPTGPLPDGVCPLFLPLRVGDRDAALAHLWARNIEAVDLWRIGDPQAVTFFEAASLRRHLIELPCHQDLGEAELDRVAAAAKEVLK